MSAPEEDTDKESTIGANLFAGYAEANRQKFAEVLVLGVPKAGVRF